MPGSQATPASRWLWPRGGRTEAGLRAVAPAAVGWPVPDTRGGPGLQPSAFPGPGRQPPARRWLVAVFTPSRRMCEQEQEVLRPPVNAGSCLHGRRRALGG